MSLATDLRSVREHTRVSMGSRQQTQWRNLGIGAFMNIFQVTSLGQPMEVVKTQMAANRKDTLRDAVKKTWHRGGLRGFYQGLIPWAWIEASTKGAILIMTSTEVERWAKSRLGVNPSIAGGLGGVAGGAAQAYLTMGMTTCMKTIEVTRVKTAEIGGRVPGTVETFLRILRSKGIRGVNKGVNAVALRQITGWASRIGITRFAEGQIRRLRGKSPNEKLGIGEKVGASVIGGGMSCWNQPFEVLRVEMQSMKTDPTRPANPTMASTLRHILRESGVRGLFSGVLPRIGVAAWATVCMVSLSDRVKEVVNFNAPTDELPLTPS